MRLSLLLFACGVLSAQTVVHLRSSGPPGVQLDPTTGVSNTTPVVVHTKTAHGFSVGNEVVVAGACAGTGVSTANGIRLVKAAIDATHYSITTLAGVDIPAGGAPCDGTGIGSASSVPGAMYTAKLTQFTIPNTMFGWYDGPTGRWTRMLTLGTGNGLVSLVVSGNVATVTTSYTHGVSAGDQISIWGAGAGGSAVALNTHNGLGAGRPYTVLSSPAPTGTTFAFTTAGVSNGTYSGVNNACGPAGTPNNTVGGTLDCLRVSQLAFVGNPFWDDVIAESTLLALNTGIEYKSVFDGGLKMSSSLQTTMLGWAGVAAVQFLVDQQNQHWLDVILYWMKNPEKIAGVNWNGYESIGQNGNLDLSDYASYVFYGMAQIYPVGRPYQLAADNQITRDKMYNDLDDPTLTACNRSHTDVSDPAGNHNRILGSGAATGGDSTHLTLALSDSAGSGFYVNNILSVGTGIFNQVRLITAYNSGTKSATVTPAMAVPTAGEAYTIYTSMTIASTTPGATTTVTGYNTHFTTEIAVGDAVLGANVWPTFNVATMSYVSVINSDTSLTVINGAATAASSTPSLLWYLQKWQTGDCGVIQEEKHWPGYPGIQPKVYTGGGTLMITASGNIVEDSNNVNTLVAGHLMLDLAVAPDDQRAINDAAYVESFGFDYNLRHLMNYGTGFTHSGAAYTPARIFTDMNNFVITLGNVPGFPSMGQTTPWMQNQSLYKMFGTLPDIRDGLVTSMGWGTDNQNCTAAPQISARILCATGYLLDPTFYYNPTSLNAQYLANWMQTITPASPQIWNHTGAAVDYFAAAPLLRIDPRQPSSDYTAQPHQRLFQESSYATCASLTNWPCPQTFRGDAVISRGGAWTDKTSTFLYFGNRAFYGDHDNPSPGMVTIYKVGELLARDHYPPWDSDSSGSPDDSAVAQSLRFGNANHFKLGAFANPITPGITPIVRWASGNHGSWDTAYGDQNSTYSYTCADLAGGYTVTIDHAIRCMIHLKKPGTEEIIAQADDVDVTSAPTPVETHFNYTQTGETATIGLTFPSSYTEGSTTCPGSGGCASLNTNRTIFEAEDGAPADARGPARTYGLITKFFSPSTITVRDDAPKVLTLTSVQKTINATIVSFTATGVFNTIVETNVAHGLIVNAFVTIAGTTGGCPFMNKGWQPIAIVDATHYTIAEDIRSCTPGGGTSSTWTRFNAPTHGLADLNTVVVTGATGSWAAYNNGALQIRVIDADHLNPLDDLDSSGYSGSFDGSIMTFFAGGFGHTHRVSVCAGSSCGATVNTFESLAVHKLSSNYLTDTTLTATAITPDANWYGVQTLDKVIILARHGVTQSTMAGFTTTHSGVAQYLIGGLTAGSGYDFKVNGVSVAGSPFTVAAGDNSIEFESTAGAVSLNGGSPVLTITTSSPLPGGTVGVPYSQTIGTANATGAVTFSVTSGTLCAGLSLGTSTGTISGTPATGQTCSFTVQAVDTLPTTVSQAYSLTIASGSVGRAPVVGGKAGAAGKVIVH